MVLETRKHGDGTDVNASWGDSLAAAPAPAAAAIARLGRRSAVPLALDRLLCATVLLLLLTCFESVNSQAGSLAGFLMRNAPQTAGAMADNSGGVDDHSHTSLSPTAPPAEAQPALRPLPQLTEQATVYSGCCLALSTRLVAHVCSLLPPPPSLTLSIGSGFGLLEALLIAAPHRPNLVGVEVVPSPNVYLPAPLHRLVLGTRFLDPLAAEARAWLFVYPRRVALLDEYMAAFGRDSGCVQSIIWLGPQADWEDYLPCFAAGWHVHTQAADQVGGKAWELIAIAKRMPT